MKQMCCKPTQPMLKVSFTCKAYKIFIIFETDRLAISLVCCLKFLIATANDLTIENKKFLILTDTKLSL